jgi:hypothetical protein
LAIGGATLNNFTDPFLCLHDVLFCRSSAGQPRPFCFGKMIKNQ